MNCVRQSEVTTKSASWAASCTRWENPGSTKMSFDTSMKCWRKRVDVRLLPQHGSTLSPTIKRRGRDELGGGWRDRSGLAHWLWCLEFSRLDTQDRTRDA